MQSAIVVIATINLLSQSVAVNSVSVFTWFEPAATAYSKDGIEENLSVLPPLVGTEKYSC